LPVKGTASGSGRAAAAETADDLARAASLPGAPDRPAIDTSLARLGDGNTSCGPIRRRHCWASGISRSTWRRRGHAADRRRGRCPSLWTSGATTCRYRCVTTGPSCPNCPQSKSWSTSEVQKPARFCKCWPMEHQCPGPLRKPGPCCNGSTSKLTGLETEVMTSLGRVCRRPAKWPPKDSTLASFPLPCRAQAADNKLDATQ
jgi:hypothetical protein